MGAFVAEVMVFFDDGKSWEMVWSVMGVFGPMDVEMVDVIVFLDLVGKSVIRFVFRISGNDSRNLVYWDVDEVKF